MLTRMDQCLPQSRDSGQSSQDGSSLHEIRTSSNDVKNVHVIIVSQKMDCTWFCLAEKGCSGQLFCCCQVHQKEITSGKILLPIHAGCNPIRMTNRDCRSWSADA